MARRLAVAVLAVVAVLLAATPARATVGSLQVDNSSPTAAAGARTQYVVTFTTSAPTGQMTLTFPAGTSFSGYSGSAVFDGTTNVGSCDSGNQGTLKINCFRTGGVIQGNHAVKITLNGVMNPGTSGPLTVITNVDPDPASAPVNVVAAQPVGTPSVDFSAPTTARGGRTVYTIGFAASSSGGLAYAANSIVTLLFPAGTSFAGYSGTKLEDTTAASGDIGFCDSGTQSTLTITCHLDTGRSIAAGHAIRITLQGIANPPSATGAVTVSTSSDTAVASGTLTFDPSHSVGPVSVTNSPPSDGAGARTVYTISFTTSATGALDYAANSTITLKLQGTSFAGYSGTKLEDTTAASGDIGFCDSGTQSTYTITCYLDTGKAIGAGHGVRITLDGIANPAAANAVTVSTTSDIQPLDSLPVPVSAAHQVGAITVDNGSPTRAAGARTVYVIGFTTSATGALAYAANSTITLKFPTGTSFAGYSGTKLEDTTTASGDIGFCDSGTQATLTITCYLDTGQAIAASHAVRITLDGIANPATAGPVAVSTTSDPQPLDSAPVAVDAAHPLTQITVDNGTPTTAAGGRTVYTIGFTTSSTGALAYAANSTITLKFPAGTSFTGYSGTAVLDGGTDVGFCDSGVQSTLTITCYLDTGRAIAAGRPVLITLRGIANPTSAGALTLSTTSDPQAVGSPTITPAPSQPVGSTSVALASTAASAITSYTIGFTTSSVGALSYSANSVITLKFPVGTAYAGSSGATVTAGGTDIGFCDSGTSSTRTTLCYLDNGRVIGAGQPVRIVVANIKNPVTQSAGNHVTVSTTSDTAADTPGYDIGADSAPPESAVTSGPSGTLTGNTVTFTFDSTEPGSTFACRLDGPDGVIGPEPCTSPKTYSGLRDGAYTFSVDAIDPAGNPDPSPAAQSFTLATATPTVQPTVTPAATPTATPPPAPEFHKDVVVQPVSGTVRVKLKGTNTFVDLASAKDIPLGSTIDVKAGKIRLASVPKKNGTPQTAVFFGGIFKVTQPGGTTDLKLNEPLASCAKARSSAAKKKPKTRKLWGQGSGSFRTSGTYSAATVRGTEWLVKDSCAGTLTQVKHGVVNVRDNVRHKTVVVRAGHTYLARPRR